MKDRAVGFVEVSVAGDTLQLPPGTATGMPIGAEGAASEPAMVGTIRGWTEVRLGVDSPLASAGFEEPTGAQQGQHVVKQALFGLVGEEAVTGLADLWTQRMRWAEGSLRRLMEHGPRLILGTAPLARKLDFLAFTGEFQSAYSFRMMPEIWLPTVTFVTGFKVPVEVTICVMSPRVTLAV